MFILLAIVSLAFYGSQPPDMSANAGTIGTFLSAHHQGILIATWLAFPTAAFFLWFGVGVRAHLAHAPGLADGLPLYAMLGAVAAIVLSLAAGAVTAVALLIPPGGNLLPALWALSMLLGSPFISMANAIFVFAAAHSMRRHGSASAAFASYGYVTALGSAIASLSLFYSSGPLAPNGWLTLVLGFVLFGIWVVWASIWLFRTTGTPAAA